MASNIYLRLPPELVERLRTCAQRDARSLNLWCVLALERAAAVALSDRQSARARIGKGKR
jgi:predicted HicB family RNase H-like nuclease